MPASPRVPDLSFCGSTADRSNPFRMKPEMWAKVAEDLQVPWRAAEAMHWALGETEMARRAGVVAFSMTPAGYGEPSTNAVSSPSSVSGMDSSVYNDALSVQEAGLGFGGRTPSGLKQSGAPREESEGGVGLGLRESYGSSGRSAMAEADEDPEGLERRRRSPVSEYSGDQGVLLPSLAEFEGGVPAYAGFVGEMRGLRTEGRGGRGRREIRGSPEVKEEEGGSGE